jgi:site-specific recombinase XerD
MAYSMDRPRQGTAPTGWMQEVEPFFHGYLLGKGLSSDVVRTYVGLARAAAREIGYPEVITAPTEVLTEWIPIRPGVQSRTAKNRRIAMHSFYKFAILQRWRQDDPIASLLPRPVYERDCTRQKLLRVPALAWETTEQHFRNHLLSTGHARQTVRAYVYYLNLFALWCVEHEVDPISAETPAVSAYLGAILDRISQQSVALRLSVIKAFYKMLRALDWRQDDPARDLSIKQPKPEPRKPFSTEDLHALLSACRNARDKAMITLAYALGLRVGEIVALQADNVDLNRSLLLVKGKGSRERWLPLDKQMTAILRPLATGGPLWLTRDGQAMSVKRAQRNMEEIARRAGVHAHWHRLRTTFANDALASGIEIQDLQVLMGHAQMDTTIHYAGAHIHRHAFESLRQLHLAHRLTSEAVEGSE